MISDHMISDKIQSGCNAAFSLNCKKTGISELLSLDFSWDRLKNTDKPVLIYGTGNACERILSEFERRKIVCSGIFASDGFVRDRDFCGYHVMSYSQAAENFGDFVICCAFGSELPEVMKYIITLSEKHKLIFPDLPVAGEEFFSKEGLSDRFDNVKLLFSELADDLSKEVLVGVLAFKITGDISYLLPIFTDPVHDISEIIKPQKSDRYADLGAYTGDTAERFIELAGGYEHLYVFEPDKKSFRKCLKKMLKYDNVTLVNAAVWNMNEIIRFSQNGSRQSMIDENGTSVCGRTLDSVVNSDRCTYIKYDVEGAEAEALNGSVQIIKRCRPRLAVSVYHRPYDIIDLPLMIAALDSGYRFYLRQAPYFPAWDTILYAVH